MKVIEIFDSIDGEGPRQGHPSTFIRLAGCNLRCGYCDTTYAFSGGQEMGIDEIVDRVRYSPNITITGGEPLFHEDIHLLLDALPNRDIIVETNGSIDLQPFLNHSNIRFVMDWKCPSSGMSDRMLESNLKALRRVDEIKFVVANESDVETAYSVIPRTNAKPVISPVFGKADLRMIARNIIERRNKTVRMQVQLHKIIWPADMRGV